MAGVMLEARCTYKMKLWGSTNELLRERILDGLNTEIVDGVLVIYSDGDAAVVFPTGVMVSFTKSEKGSENQ